MRKHNQKTKKKKLKLKLIVGIGVGAILIGYIAISIYQYQQRQLVSACNMIPQYENCSVEEYGVPETEEDFERLERFMIFSDDFNHNWIEASYEVRLGDDDPPSSFYPYQQRMNVTVCSDLGQVYAHKIDQAAYCLTQYISEYEDRDTSYEVFHGLISTPRPQSTTEFPIEKKVESLGIRCGMLDPDPINFFYEPYNICTLWLQNGRYYIWTRVLFDVSEETVSYEEVGEIFNLIQDRLLAESQN